MMKKGDFVWHIGFQGNMAVVNQRQKMAMRNLDPGVLLSASFYRAGFCSALWETEIENKAESLPAFIKIFKAATAMDTTVDELKRMMGVFHIPQGNLRILKV